MASSSSSSSLRTCKYHVFPSFHGPEVRQTFISHLRKLLETNGITMFDDEGIEKGQIISPALKEAIRESSISIVVLSKNYASSSWCLYELLYILKIKKDLGQIVITVFHGVNPSDVRKQAGDFGIAFNQTCAGKTEKEKRKWSQALTYVGNIAGYHFQSWNNEAEKMEELVRDVSGDLYLNATSGTKFYFDGEVEATRAFIESLKCNSSIKKYHGVLKIEHVSIAELNDFVVCNTQQTSIK